MAEEHGLYMDFEGPMPINHGPYLPLSIDRSIPKGEDVDWLDYEYSLGQVLRDENLEISDVALQSLYQHARQLDSIEGSLVHYSLAGQEGAAVVQTYWDIKDAMRVIVDFEEHPDFERVFMHMVSLEIDEENTNWLLDQEEPQPA